MTHTAKTSKRSLTLAALLALPLLACAAQAQWRTLYQNDFEAREFGYEWSSNTRLESWYPTFTNFNGNYSTEFTQLTLPAVPREPGRTGSPGGTGGSIDGTYRVKFDLYVIDSWDGSERTFGTDRLQVLVNNLSRFDHTFSNHNQAWQSFSAPVASRRNLGFNDQWADAIYRDITIDIPASTVTDRLAIRWQDTGLQGTNDESWGIDNINVSYNPIPAPGLPAAALASLALVTTRRRR